MDLVCMLIQNCMERIQPAGIQSRLRLVRSVDAAVGDGPLPSLAGSKPLNPLVFQRFLVDRLSGLQVP